MDSNRSQPGTRIPARQLTTMALLLALGAVLSFIEFPLLPGTDFLKYDAANVPALLVGFAYGPLSGCLVAALIPWLHSLFAGNPWGAVMNMVIGVAYVLPASLLFKASRGLGKQARVQLKRTAGFEVSVDRNAGKQQVEVSRQGISGNIALIVGLLISCVLAVGTAMVMNYFVTPIYTGAPVQAIVSMMIPILLPFNILKTLLNSILGGLLMKSLHSFIK